MAGDSMSELTKSRCFNGVSICIVAVGMCNHRVSLFRELIVKRGGQQTSTVTPSTTHVIAHSWSMVEAAFVGAPWVIREIVGKVWIVSWKWVTACLKVAQLVDCEEFDLLLLQEEMHPPRSICFSPKQILVLVPDPAHVERVIALLKINDERFESRQRKLRERYICFSDGMQLMRKLYSLGNVVQGDEMKKSSVSSIIYAMQIGIIQSWNNRAEFQIEG